MLLKGMKSEAARWLFMMNFLRNFSGSKLPPVLFYNL